MTFRAVRLPGILPGPLVAAKGATIKAGVTRQEFIGLVEAAIEQIPARFRRRLTNVAFVVKAESPGGRLLGLHESLPPLPDRITIYQRPHEEEARGNRAALERLVLETVLHEVGHALGMNEAEVRAMERSRRGHWSRHAARPGLFPHRANE